MAQPHYKATLFTKVGQIVNGRCKEHEMWCVEDLRLGGEPVAFGDKEEMERYANILNVGGVVLIHNARQFNAANGASMILGSITKPKRRVFGQGGR